MEFHTLILAGIVSLMSYAEGYPIHASCKIQWNFPSVTCADFGSRIVAQAKKWETADNCANGGEKCLYKVSSQSVTEIKGTHETPVKHYVDDLTFTMKPAGSGCTVDGFSTSETWYAYLDYSTNYCNLNNLITGAGLNATQGYKETTSDDVCTQYSSRNCEKY
ncbi:uncharacterized protein LOC128547029 [Mercenaria mercenaria]|uniref:uncharacterized protein LOC128547029 n=1 Tax=Mercenaria mercenaria TaxID=6596 RepID=UPI00234E37EA|nr:uncharacterized protein LOC128547029 [Mercenaria mercenaria]